MAKRGRPTKYTEALGLRICKELSHGRSLRRICEDEKMPNASTVHEWILDGKHEDFAKQYAQARTIQAEQMFDEILDIADDGSNDFILMTKGDVSYNMENKEVTNRSRLRVDSRKWYLSKVLPKKYGDKLDLTTAGKELPTPILANALHPDHRDKEDNRPHRED